LIGGDLDYHIGTENFIQGKKNSIKSIFKTCDPKLNTSNWKKERKEKKTNLKLIFMCATKNLMYRTQEIKQNQFRIDLKLATKEFIQKRKALTKILHGSFYICDS
jgi:hypothetical protein